jgi:predicted permease
MVIAGFALAKFKLVNHSLAPSLIQFVLYAAAPCQVFYAMVSNPLSKLLYWQFWVAYPLSLLIVVVITFFIFKVILRRNLIDSLIAGYCATVLNTAIIGYPALSGFVGHVAAIISTTTVYSVITIPFVTYLTKLLWPMVFQH